MVRIGFLLGAQGAFVGSAGTPPVAIFFGFAIPLAVFFCGVLRMGAHSGRSSSPPTSGSWQRFRRGGGPRRLPRALCAGCSAGTIRFPGWTRRIMAIGVSAPWIVLGALCATRLSRSIDGCNVEYHGGSLTWSSPFHWGPISSGFLRGLTGTVTTGPMATFTFRCSSRRISCLSSLCCTSTAPFSDATVDALRSIGAGAKYLSQETIEIRGLSRSPPGKFSVVPSNADSPSEWLRGVGRL